MLETEIYFAVREIDNHLEELIDKNTPLNELKSIIDLRNKLLLKHKPSPDLDWTIQKQTILNFLKKENWHVRWVATDMPI